MKLSVEEIDLLADGLDLVLSSTIKEIDILDNMSNLKVKLDKMKLINSLASRLSLELESK
jgi:hypothetical protein